MANILENTMTGTAPVPTKTPDLLTAPEMSGDNQADIGTLENYQQKPGSLVDLTKAMGMASSVAYKQRQAQEMELASKQFDPTKVSGGTFADIVGTMEKQRGGDISKIYGTTMAAYNNAQTQITQRLQFMQQLEQDRMQFEEQMELQRKQQDLDEEKWEEDKRRYEQEYRDAKAKAKAQIEAAKGLNKYYGNWDEIASTYNYGEEYGGLYQNREVIDPRYNLSGPSPY